MLFHWKPDKMQQNKQGPRFGNPRCLALGYSFTVLSSVCVTADAWKSLTDKVQEARSNARLKQLSFAGSIRCQTRFYRKTLPESLDFLTN